VWSNARAYLFDNKYADAMRKIMLCLCLLCIGTIARGQTSYEYVYWLDNDMASGRMSVTSGDSWQTDVDVACLSDGLHSLHIQVRNTDSVDVWSSPVTRYFIKQTSHSEEMTYRYWFDNDNATMVVSNEELAWLDVSALDDGLHMLHVMAEGTVATQTLSCQFLKIPQTDGVDYLHCLCYLDGKLYHQERVASSGGIVHWEFDVSELAQGIHNIQVQTVTPSGAATGLYESMFLRTTTHAEMASLKCFYTIDGAESYIEAGTYADGAFHFDLDVATLDDGLHQLAYMLVGDNGVSTKVSSAFFMKTPLGGNGITQYWYWLNDDDANKTVVKLEERTNPFQLIGLLPVESVPIRSSLFHFEVDEEQGPMVYAKNEFHIRFYDATGRLVDATKSYLDYNVSEKVTGTEEIKKSQTFARPVENGIKWFTLQACEGDTIAFRSSQALSLQVFSPSGKELYAASGAESVKWGGCHTWEEGTHYVAVHDVTGSRPNVTLDYLHMDKYDVVDQDVRVVGNGGCSTITFYGNGFDYLKSVCLINDLNDTIRCFSVNHVSDASVSCIFDFAGNEVGIYNALFEFVDESKLFNEAIIVEEPTDMSITTHVEYPAQYLRGTTTSYTIQVRNNGNMTAYSLPLYLYISTPSLEGISYIDVEGLELPGIFSEVDMTDFSDEDKQMLGTLEKSIGDSHYFIKSKTVDADTGDSIITRAGYFFVNIAPHSTKTIELNITSNETVDAWVTIPDSWHSGKIEDAVYVNSMRSTQKMNPYCCYRDKIECVANILVDGLDLVSAITGCLKCPASVAVSIVDCAASALNTVISSIGTVMCDENNFKEDFAQAAWNVAQRVGMSLPGTIMGCASTFLGLNKKDDAAQLLSSLVVSWDFTVIAKPIIDCSKAFSQKIPGCPPVPPKGGKSSPVNSFDPNEIYGYLSPSGSKFIAKDSVETVNYRIEFENDTAFATSSAHVVEIRDTLDACFFELGTFAPTYISIGDKREQLDGTPNFVRTVDMRPQINAVVQVEGEYDEQTGIARWLFTSLDPMTMEPTDDVMQGFLPVNHDGTSGIGDVAYRIGLKKGMDDGTLITNRASIVFDSNEPILTPTWTNIVDGSAPTSEFLSVEELNDTVIRLRWKGGDENSPAWRYSLAVQAVEDTEWFEFLPNTTDTVFDYRYYRDIDYGFCVLATDSAGNVESREWVRKVEFMREYIAGDADRSGTVNLLDLNLTLSHILGNEVDGCDMLQMDANGDGSINVLDINAILQIILDADGEGAAQRKRDSGVIRIINTKVI